MPAACKSLCLGIYSKKDLSNDGTVHNNSEIMLKIKYVTERSEELGKIDALYKRAFPDHERSPLEPLLRDISGRGEVISFLTVVFSAALPA